VTRLRLATIVGTRPELIKLSAVIAEADRRFDHVFVHTGQNHDPALVDAILADLTLRVPDERWAVADTSPARAIANVLSATDAFLDRARPDAVLILGDTDSGLAALAARRRHVPTFHMEAGNRCFDPRVPEEVNRRLLDHVCDVNLPFTGHARANLLAEGLPGERIIVTGSPMGEVLARQAPALAGATTLAALGLDPGGYILASAHRAETVDDPATLARWVQSLGSLASHFGQDIVVAVHPRTRARLAAAGHERFPARVTAIAPQGFHAWLLLQKHAFCVVSDSGTLSEEAALLGFPAVMPRPSHERPEGVEAGVFVRADLEAQALVAAVTQARALFARKPVPPEDYLRPRVAAHVCDLIETWTGPVARGFAPTRAG
jgi:UDP-N-acetylglucosamine 2-epimerase